MKQRYQQNPAAEVAPLGQGLMILEPKERKFCALNPTSSLIWARLAEPASLDQLEKHIYEHFHDVSESQASEDVRAIVQEMTLLGIVVPVV
jgi:Coenzyme PQQ synthesis protein D (PqqD)